MFITENFQFPENSKIPNFHPENIKLTYFQIAGKKINSSLEYKYPK